MQAGVRVVRYDGCVNPDCNKHTWHEKEKGDICPLCGEKRYDDKGRPRESVFYFPIKERLEALVWNSPAFFEALHHEISRVKPDAGIIAGKRCLLLLTCF